MNPAQSSYLLLQVNDALFPIGGYSHSYGLESYIDRGLVHDEKTAEAYIRARLINEIQYCELLTVRLACEAALRGDIDGMRRIDMLTEALRTPSEIREALRRLGSRFIKTVRSLELQGLDDIFERYTEGPGPHHHPTAYGVFAAAAGIGCRDALSHYLYGQTSAIVTCCVKSIPLSQTSGQQILNRVCELFEPVIENTAALGEDDLGRSTPGFDLRSMQHETQYSRLYMS